MLARYICILIRSDFPEQDFWSPICFQNHPICYNGPRDSNSNVYPSRLSPNVFKSIFIIIFPCQTLFSLLVHQILLRFYYMRFPVKDSTPLVLDLVPSLHFKPSTLVNAFPHWNFQILIFECFPHVLFERIPVSCGDIYIYICTIDLYESLCLFQVHYLSRCYVIKRSYFKLLNDVFE